jgi:hypothetical protein
MINGHDTLVATSARRCGWSIGGGGFRGSPDFTAVLLHQSDIPKLASRRDLCFLSGHTADHEFLDLLFQVHTNF